jgi:hypothetical protein
VASLDSSFGVHHAVYPWRRCVTCPPSQRSDRISVYGCEDGPTIDTLVRRHGDRRAGIRRLLWRRRNVVAIDLGCQPGGGPETILGDMRLLGQAPLPEAYAETIDSAIICTITPDELRRLIERYPVIDVNIITFLSSRLREAERELEAMAYQRVGQRLARKLIDLAQRFGVETVRGTLIQARLTQQELAEMIGTTRETLAHTLADFRRRDLLDTNRNRVVIRDAERLAEVARDGDRD